VVLIVVLVCVAVAAAVLMAVLRMSLAERESFRLQTRQLQAAWLAESGLERAAARLAADPQYAGETWHIAAEELGGLDAAVVTIRVEPAPHEPARRLVRVEADYPDHPQFRARKSKQVLVLVPNLGQ